MGPCCRTDIRLDLHNGPSNFFEAEWLEYIYKEGAAEERVSNYVGELQNQIKALRVLLLPELTQWIAKMILLRSRDRHIDWNRRCDYFTDMDDMPYPPEGHEVPVTERAMALSTSLGSHILHGEAIAEKLNTVEARLDQILAELPSGHIGRTTMPTNAAMKLGEHTVLRLPDTSLGLHDCGVASMVEIIRLRGIAQGNEYRHLIRLAEEAGETRLAESIARYHQPRDLQYQDRPTISEMAAVVGPLLYAIRTWDGWELYYSGGATTGTRPALTVQYASPILIVDQRNRHITVGLLTIGPDDLEERCARVNQDGPDLIPMRVDINRYGMWGPPSLGDEGDLTPIKDSEPVTLRISSMTPSPDYERQSDILDDRDGSVTPEMEATMARAGKPESSIRESGNHRAEGPLNDKSAQHHSHHLITPTIYIRTADQLGSPTTISMTLSRFKPRTQASSAARARFEQKDEAVGRSGGLTIKATKALFKQPGIRDALADPLRTAATVRLAMQASTEPGLLIGVPYSQPATRSVVADGLCGLHAFTQYTIAISTHGEDGTGKLSQPLQELHQALATSSRLCNNPETAEAYWQFLQSTLTLLSTATIEESIRLHLVMGNHYDTAVEDVRKLLRMLSDPRTRPVLIGTEYWQKGHVLTLLCAANGVPLDLFGPYIETSGQLEGRRLRVEQRSDGKTALMDSAMTVAQINTLLLREQGGVGLVDNHFYLLGPLHSLLGEVEPALTMLAGKMILIVMGESSGRRKRKSAKMAPPQTMDLSISSPAKPQHSDMDAARFGLHVKKSNIGAGRGLFTINRIPANCKITSMPGLALSRELQDIIAQATTGVERFQNVINSRNGRAVDPGGMERYYFYGHLANTALNPEDCNADYRWPPTEEFPDIYSTKIIAPGAEIIVSYGSLIQTAQFFMHPDRLVQLRPEERQKFLDEYQTDILKAGYSFPPGMRPQGEPAMSRRSESAARRKEWRDFEGPQHGTRHARKESGEARAESPQGELAGQGTNSPMVQPDFEE